MSQYPKACIIGAGISGLSTAKALKDKGVPFDCFEMSDQVGGNWVFKNKNGRSSAYRSLHIDTSKERLQLDDFPVALSDPNLPDYPHHTHVAKYMSAADVMSRVARSGVCRVDRRSARSTVLVSEPRPHACGRS